MKKTFLKAAIPTLAMLLVAIMALTGTTYAWFTETKTASVETIDVKVTAASGMKITTAKTASTNSGWKAQLPVTEVSASLDKVWPDIADFKPTSTNARLNGTTNGFKFFSAEVDENDYSKITNVVENTTDFIKFDVYLWNDGATQRTVKLTNTTIKFTGTEGTDPDATVSARVALIGRGTKSYTGTEDFATIADASGDAILGVFDTQAEATFGLKATGSGQYATNAASDVAEKYEPTNITGAGSTSFTIPPNAYKKLTVYIWLEGQDSECVNTITQGKFAVDLFFDGNDGN